MVKNNAINKYSESLAVGPSAEGLYDSTRVLYVRSDGNAPRGAAIENWTDGNASYASLRLRSDVASGDFLAFSTSHAQAFASKYVVATVNVNSSGWAEIVDNSGMNFKRFVNDGTLLYTQLGTGERTMPLQPCFLANNASDQLNVTGDGTVYTCAFGTEIFDQGSDFASNTFTAPVTGRYLLTTFISTFGLTASVSYHNLKIVTSNRTYEYGGTTTGTIYEAFTGSAVLGKNVTVIADMDAGDTATVAWTAGGTTKTIDFGSGSYFSGYLIC